MRNELHKFIKEIAGGDRTKYTTIPRIGEERLKNEFAALLGCKHHHTSSSRPDNDPKWTPFMWGIPGSSNMVCDVRVMKVNYYSAHCLKECVNHDTCFPNGWNVRELVDTLIVMRRAYKRGSMLCHTDDLWGPEEYCDTNSNYHQYQMIAKILLNLLYSVVCRYGSAIGIGPHKIDAAGREKTTEIVKKISETGIVLYAALDLIVYVGDQVDIPDVHHEKIKHALIMQRGNRPAVVYGDDVHAYGLPRLKLRMGEWNYLIGQGTYEELRDKVEISYQRWIDWIKKSLFDYIAITKDDIEKEIADFDFDGVDSKPDLSFNMV